MTVQHFVVPGLGRRLTAEILYREILRLAADHQCAGIRIEVEPETEWALGFFRERGHDVITWMLHHQTLKI